MTKTTKIRILLLVAFLFSSNLASAALTPGSWVNPIGVPTPSFGTTQFVGTLPTPWNATNRVSSEGNVFYFICPTCAGATDVNNTYGYPTLPRSTMPVVVNGPAVVVLGGQIDTSIRFTGNGTATSPIYVIGLQPKRIAA